MTARQEESPKSKNILVALKACISNILNPSESPLASAECNLETLEYTEEFGIFLTSLTMDKSENLGFRQLAAVILNQYIESHWTPLSDKFREPEVTEAAKAQIKTILPCGLNDSDSKMRTSVANAVAHIAYWDWPHNWPELFNILSHCLAGDDNSVHGSMKVLLEFTKDVNPDNLPTVAPIILSEVYRIFDANKIYRSKTRAQAVQIYVTFCEHIFSAYSCNNVSYSLCLPTIAQFIERFMHSLENEQTDCFLRMQIMKAIWLLKRWIPLKILAPYISRMVSRVWNLFQQATQDYHKMVINGLCVPEPVYDLDGELFSYEKYTILYLSFFKSCTRKRIPQLEPILQELLTCLLILIKITNQQRDEWIKNPDSYLDEDFFAKPDPVAVRHKSLLLFKNICEEYQKQCFVVLGPVLVQFVQVSEQEKNQYVLGCIKSILHKNYSNITELNIPEFTRNALNHLCHPNLDFLVGRCLWLSGKFVEALAMQVMMRYLEVLQGNIDYRKNDVIKILAMETLISYCENLPLKNDDVVSLFSNYMPEFYNGLIGICQHCKSAELCLSLQALIALVNVTSVSSRCPEPVEQKVIPLLLEIYNKLNSDPHVFNLVLELIGNLMKSRYENAVTSTFVPHIVEIFRAGSTTVENVQQCIALEVLKVIVKNSKSPLNDALLKVAFPQAVECILSTTDHATQQSGGECLRAYLSVFPNEVCSFRDGEGLVYFVRVVSQLLDPNTSEKAATSVGRLVITLIMKAGNLLGEQMDVILKSVLSKLQRAQTLSVVMSLVIIFAHLFLTQMDAVINFLLTVPGPMGKSALDYVLTEWCTRQHLFYGMYERKVCALALCKLFEYIISSNDTQITNIKVRADTFAAIDEEPKESEEVFIVFKIFKLLLLELWNLMEGDHTDDEQVSGDDYEITFESNDEDTDDSEDETIDDSDYTNEPVFQICMRSHLKDFIRTFAKSPSFPPFVEFLDNEEKKILQLFITDN
ncbi:importin-9-like [Ctenocephalides felis]|uniref:importin-9-like n=1 Tax=Ctenocephalides felis TaxID=7515 RepID=UPI000E6E2495|nr:importin-9-like [Ctenocephalides felis]